MPTRTCRNGNQTVDARFGAATVKDLSWKEGWDVYSCTECGEALEVQQSFSDDPLTVCPVCQGRLRKLFLGPAMRLRWHWQYNPKLELWITWWAMVVFYQIFGIVFVLMTRVMPPPKPWWEPARIAQWFADTHDGLAWGFGIIFLISFLAPACNALIGYSMGGYGVLAAAGATLDPAGGLVSRVPGGLLQPFARGGALSAALVAPAVKAVVAIAPAGGAFGAFGAAGLAGR